MSKKDKELGLKVNKHLKNKGVETPMNLISFNKEGSKNKIQEHFKGIMTELGLNLQDDSLQDTPKRVAKMFVNEIFSGLNYENFPKCTAIENKMQYDEPVIQKGVNIQSFCEHHFVSIEGTAVIAYIPNKKVIGLSKMNRIADFFSKRPQVQERLTQQIFFTLQYILETPDVAVIIKGTHNCVRIRGVKDINTETITSKFGGKFENKEERKRLISLI